MIRSVAKGGNTNLSPDPVGLTIATQAFSGLLANLTSSYLRRKTRVLGSPEQSLRVDLGPHFESTFERCLNIKTIINDAPINMLSIYVDQHFKPMTPGINSPKIDQYSLIENIRHGQSTVILGNGGGGKSMFMRYLWLSYFEKSDGKIPFFFEMRQVNSVSHPNFLDYIYHSIVQTKSTITQKQFNDAIHAGEIVLFLDGFDEISLEKRREIEQAINDLSDNNPKLTMVVTSRPDFRFSGWRSFHVVEVQPLEEQTVVALIERAQYDATSKTRLLKRIKEGLYNSHRSFLSNPLLAYMMLLTIARNPDIPTQMHSFYEMAFDALFHRHDTTKGGYVRQFRTGLDKSTFIKYLSYFCLITYHDECTEADEQKLLEYIKRSANFDGSSVNEENFLQDLVDNVCLLKRDGLSYNFIHRSFQEYFAALCICRIASRKLDKLFSVFAKRHDDQVMKLIYDINPDLFREKYIIPLEQKYRSYLSGKLTNNHVQQFLIATEGRFVARNVGRHDQKKKNTNIDHDRILVTLQGDGEIHSLDRTVRKLKPEISKSDSQTKKNRSDEDEKFFIELSKKFQVEIDLLSVSSDGARFLYGKEDELRHDEGMDDLFEGTYMFEYGKKSISNMRKFISDEIKKYNVISHSFEELI